jgi:hypothetical protein
MIEAYLQSIDALLSASPLVRDVEIVRRTIRDTEFEKVLHYRMERASTSDHEARAGRRFEPHGGIH